MLNGTGSSHVRVFVVWQPMLRTDWARPGYAALKRVTDRRASQYWDKNHLVARKLGEALDSDPSHPHPECCEDEGIPWDLVAVYPPQVRWKNSLPRAIFLDGPVFRKKAELRAALSKLGVK